MPKSKLPANDVFTIIVTLAAAITILALYQAYGPPGAVPSAMPASGAEPSFFSWAYWQVTENDTSRSEVLRNVGILAAAVVGLGFGIWRAVTAHWQARAARSQADTANEQARIAAQGQITERFSKAIEQLGDDNVSVRIGGLYALRRIAEDSPYRDHLAVMDVITNFIRHPPYAEAQIAAAADYLAQLEDFESAQAGPEDLPAPRHLEAPDILAALEILQIRSDQQKAVESAHNYDLSLERANLRHLRLVGAKLANLPLKYSIFDASDLTIADFTGADLTSADLIRAVLRETDFSGADLHSAVLDFSDLTSACLFKADLAYANFSVADITYADLTGANLTGTKLSKVRGLTQSQLDRVKYDRKNLAELPTGLTLPAQRVEVKEPEPGT